MSTENLTTEGINNPLVTPEFTGTDEEIISALGYWNALVMHVRTLSTVVTSHPNKVSIISHLEREVALIKAEVENVSAKLVPNDGHDIPQMRQPAQLPDQAEQSAIAHAPKVMTAPAPEAPHEVNLSATNEALNKIRAMAGVKQVRPSAFEKALDEMSGEKLNLEPVVTSESGVVVDTGRFARMAGIPSARELRAKKAK